MIKNTPKPQTMQHDANVSECMSGAGKLSVRHHEFQRHSEARFLSLDSMKLPGISRQELRQHTCRLKFFHSRSRLAITHRKSWKTCPGVRDGLGGPTCSKCTANTSGPPGPPRLATTSHRLSHVAPKVSKIYSIILYISVIFYNYLCLRRGGTKASACFLTLAGARETPPHPYGMAQTWSAPTSTIAIGS